LIKFDNKSVLNLLPRN